MQRPIADAVQVQASGKKGAALLGQPLQWNHGPLPAHMATNATGYRGDKCHGLPWRQMPRATVTTNATGYRGDLFQLQDLLDGAKKLVDVGHLQVTHVGDPEGLLLELPVTV